MLTHSCCYLYLIIKVGCLCVLVSRDFVPVLCRLCLTYKHCSKTYSELFLTKSNVSLFILSCLNIESSSCLFSSVLCLSRGCQAKQTQFFHPVRRRWNPAEKRGLKRSLDSFYGEHSPFPGSKGDFGSDLGTGPKLRHRQ